MNNLLSKCQAVKRKLMVMVTSIDTMTEKERELYEWLIPNSIELLRLLETSFREKPIYLEMGT